MSFGPCAEALALALGIGVESKEGAAETVMGEGKPAVVTARDSETDSELGCSTGTGTGTGDPVSGSPDPVVNNARWRPLGSQGENKSRKKISFTVIYIQVYIRMRLQNQATGTANARLPSGGHRPSRCHLRTLLIAPQAALAAVWRWPNTISSRPGHVGQLVCGANKKIITGRPVPVQDTLTW
jgi:hypothetical protein